MVLESRLAELLQGQAKKFINGFNAEHLNLGLLSGFLELRNLALNPEPIDELLLGSDLPFVVKAGTLSSAMLQLSLMQGELEIVVDGLTLVMAPACKWLTREEVYQHRTNEMERLEFVHMRSQSQRRSLEREMFRKLFSDYLSRIKITVKNVHVRVEIEGEKCQMRETGHPLSLGLVMNSCDIVPVVETEKGGGGAAGGARESEFLLAETMQLKGLMLYEEGLSKTLVPWSLYQSTRTCELGIFQKMSQDEFVRTMNQTREAHGAVPAGQLLLPPTDVSIKVDLKSQALFTDCHVENCLTLEVVVCLQNPSRLRVTASIVEGMRWLVRRTFDFQMWPFLHALHGKPANGLGRWHVLRSFLALKRRIQSNTYSLPDALRMRIHCKEYIRLYKKKFNGPQSSFHWRRSLPPLTAEDATRLGLIELTYPAEKLVNFRLMAQTEMKTETSINSFAEEGALGDFKRSPRSQVWQVRELTPMEQLHLHGQHGFGTNIFRGLPPPPSNLKVRIDLVAPLGLWWVCKLGAAGDEGSWAVSLDSGRQPVRLLLVDSISDNSVFATCEVPRRAESRPAAVLLARSEAAFQRVLERAPNQLGGGSGASEWSSMLEFHGDLCCWGQVKTLPMAASHSPWDFFGSFSCGQSSSTPNDTSFGRVTPLDELLAKFPRMHGSMLQSASSTAGQQEPFLRMNLPLRLTSGQDGPFLELLRWCLATPEGRGGANSQSMLSGLAMLVRSGYDLAALRLHVSLPKVFLQGVNCHETPLQLPPFDAACHLENGGLVDGFVVGLHNLYNFANLVASMPDVKRPKAANVVPASNARRQMSNVQPVSLHFLEQAPPLLLALGALLAASAVVLAGGRKSCMASKCGEGHELVKLATENGLFGVAAGRTTGEPTLAGITLIPTLLAVLLGRRALYDRLQGQRGDHADPSEVFKFFAATLHVLLAMGFPVHRSSLPLAAWVGSVELLQVLSQGCKDFNVTSTQGTELMSWSARGVYANPAKGPVQVLKWLMHRKASPEQRDSAGRSVLDWACWAGCDELVSFLLRRRPALDDPQPLLLAAASRSSSLVRLLLRAAGDPHAVPNTGDSHSAACGALMLAVRCCEFELACEVLRSAGAVNVAVALGTGRSAPRLGMENEEKPGSATRATVALVESFRRFANGLQRRSVEEVSVAGIRAHLPGPHPDENLYATSNMPLGDVLHPLVAKLSSPMHRVPLELRPGLLPLAWLRRTSTPDPWAPARLMVECLVQRGFRADAAFLSKVGLALPPEVQSLTGRLTEGTEGAPMLPMLLTDIIPDMRRADEISILKDAYGMPVEMFNGKMKFPTLSKGMVDELQKAGVYEEKTVIPSVADYLKDLCAPPPPEVPRPAIRVVVFGAPRVGKSTVTKILADYLEVSYEEDDGPRRLRTVQGCWPLSGTPLVEVLLWDTAQDLPDLITDSRAATFAVAVVDGADGSGSAIAAAMAQGCVSDEAQSTAPRRALIVENCFPERDLDETETNTTGRSSTHPLLQTIQCNVLDEEGQNSLKKVFGKIMAEMVGQIEARQEASKSVEKPLQPCGQGDFREVLARDSSLPCSARKPLGRRAHAYRLRGLSMCVDPVAASMAWQALQAARSTLPHEVQNLTGSSPPSSSWRSALVAPEPLQQTLQMGEAGVSGENLSATLRRALLELSLICPVQAGKDASVLVPDFAERINISASMVRQLLDSPKSIFLRLVWSREKHSARAPPSLRRTLRKFFSLTSRPFVLRYFARLDGQSAFPPEIGANSPSPECTECSVMRGAQRVGLDSDLEPGFILAFDSSVDSPAHLDQTGHSSVPGLADLLAAPALGLTFLLVMAGPNDTWDVLSSGPKATWAWRAFASHLPKFTGLVPAAAARGTRRAAEDAARRTPAPRWALRVQSGAAAGAALSLEELATTAWLLAGPQSKDVRDSLVLDQSFSSFCCAALCGSRGLRGHLEDPAEELEVRLFMRSWREIPYFLNESLQSSESWSLCAFCLQRFARDFDLVGVSKRGAYLPFLQLQGEQVFAFHLDPERPAAASKSPVLQMEAELPSALHAWLTICQPLALWAACGARNATGGVSAADGMQIAKALQKACSSGFFSEQQNLELREALREKAVMPLNGEA